MRRKLESRSRSHPETITSKSKYRSGCISAIYYYLKQKVTHHSNTPPQDHINSSQTSEIDEIEVKSIKSTLSDRIIQTHIELSSDKSLSQIETNESSSVSTSSDGSFNDDPNFKIKKGEQVLKGFDNVLTDIKFEISQDELSKKVRRNVFTSEDTIYSGYMNKSTCKKRASKSWKFESEWSFNSV